jgi:uncharacterized membrane protein
MSDDKKNPRDVPLIFTNRDTLIELIALTAIIFTMGLVISHWGQLPDSIPRHFGPTGKPDAWGSKFTVLLVPFASLVLYMGMTIMNRYPRLYNIPWKITPRNAVAQLTLSSLLMRVLKAEVGIMFTYITWKTIQVALQVDRGIGARFLFIMIGIIAATLVFYYIGGTQIEKQVAKGSSNKYR